MRSIFIAVAAIATTFVSAQNIVSITSPLTGTVYTAGKAALISWIDASVDTIPAIVIAQGDPNALQPVQTIASNVDASAGSYTWNIPADFAPGTDYALELGVSPNISFTGLFTIQAGDGSTPSSSASSSDSASASASASASVSASASAVSTSSASVAVSSSASSQAVSSSVSPSASSSASASASSTPNAASKKTASALVGVMAGSAAVAILLA